MDGLQDAGPREYEELKPSFKIFLKIFGSSLDI